jgi:hypothetical protein
MPQGRSQDENATSIAAPEAAVSTFSPRVQRNHLETRSQIVLSNHRQAAQSEQMQSHRPTTSARGVEIGAGKAGSATNGNRLEAPPFETAVEPEPTVNIGLGDSGSLQTDESMQTSRRLLTNASPQEILTHTVRTANVITQNSPSPTDAAATAMLGTPPSSNLLVAG